MPKPLFTRGETKKRQFGKTTMSDDGMKYFKKGISNWKMAFNDRGGELYDTLVQGWSAWLEEEASAIDIEGGWRRKNLHSLLRTREEKEDPEGDDAVDEGQDGDEGELFACYDSDGDDGFIAPNARGGQRRTLEADIEDEGEGTIVDSNNNRKRGDEDDEDEDEDGDIVDGNNNRKRGDEDDEEDGDEDGDKDEEGEEQEKEQEKEQWKGGNRGANAGNKRKRGEMTGMGRKSRVRSK